MTDIPQVWAIGMVKDEADIIEATLRHVSAEGAHGILLTDNGSTDGTREIIESLQDGLHCPLYLYDDPVIGYWQSRKMTSLAEQAHESFGATWIWPFDADEVWQRDLDTATVAEILMGSPFDVEQAVLYHHLCTALDPADHPFVAMGYRLHDPAPIPKVCIRWQPGARIEAGNHEVTLPGASTGPPTGLQIRHYPYRSEDQFVRKAINGSRAYRETDLPWHVGQHWREYGLLYERGGEEALREAFRAHFTYDLPSASGLVYDPVRIREAG